MNLNCIKCGLATSNEVRLCPGCGADTELELEIAMFLDPAVKSLRAWLLIAGGLLIVFSGLNYEHNGILTFYQVLLGGSGAVFVASSLFVKRAPLPVASVASGLFLTIWGYQLYELGALALFPGVSLLLKVFSAVILGNAVRAALKARATRARVRDALPKATATINS